MKEKENNKQQIYILPIGDLPSSIPIPNNIVSIETVEKAAFDVIQAYYNMKTNEQNDPFELNQSHALVTVIATQIVNRVKQLTKEKI